MSNWTTSSRLCAALLLCLALCPPVGARAETGDADGPPPKLFILSFNRWGDLANPAERDLAMQELADDRTIERIIIFSYGWANDGEASYGTYHDLLRELRARRPKGRRVPKTAVIAVGWDSAQSGFRKLFNDILPFPALASGLATVPDQLLFPISFWSKAATADRIGFGGLRTSLNAIFEHAYPGGQGTPDIFLVGHSFGTRIVSELMQDKIAVFPVRAEPFVGRKQVRGAMLLQPAIAEGGLHKNADYPILVTQSEHDHAVGGLFPFANLLINTSTFTSFEALFRYRFFDPFDRGVSKVARTVGEVTRTLPGEEPEGAPRGQAALTGSLARTAVQQTSRAWYLGLRAIGELASVPVAMLSGALTTPFNYVYVQAHGLFTQPWQHTKDTLAQLPLAEALMAGVDRLTEPEIPSGRRGKGFLNLGALNESVGRLYTPALIGGIPSDIFTLDDFARAKAEEGCGLPRCKGILLLDATDFIEVGSFGLSLNRPAVDFTLGWLDPLGSHTDYKNETVVRLMADFFETASSDARE